MVANAEGFGATAVIWAGQRALEPQIFEATARYVNLYSRDGRFEPDNVSYDANTFTQLLDLVSASAVRNWEGI